MRRGGCLDLAVCLDVRQVLEPQHVPSDQFGDPSPVTCLVKLLVALRFKRILRVKLHVRQSLVVLQALDGRHEQDPDLGSESVYEGGEVNGTYTSSRRCSCDLSAAS